MQTDPTKILAHVREAVSQVTEKSLQGVNQDDDLRLDSINRISLIAELENVFQVELSGESVAPEAFVNLKSLCALVKAHLK